MQHLLQPVIEQRHKGRKLRWKVNFTQGVSRLKNTLVDLLVRPGVQGLANVMELMANSLSAVRPGRSFPRQRMRLASRGCGATNRRAKNKQHPNCTAKSWPDSGRHAPPGKREIPPAEANRHPLSWRLGRTCAELGSKTSEGTAATARPSPGFLAPARLGLKLMTLGATSPL